MEILHFALFAIVALIAVAAAAGMILNENAVHSALFLIVNFVCVAFLYLMLEAPFLSMVQIAVYAGAIMVLFLFVIMLLGAENAESDAPKRNWIYGVTGAAFVLLALFTIAWSNSSQFTPPQNTANGPARVRFVNAAPVVPEPQSTQLTQDQAETGGETAPEVDVPTEEDIQTLAAINLRERRFDIFVNDELLIEDFTLDEVSDFTTLQAGEYTVMFSPVDTAVPFATTTLSLDAGDMVTVVLNGVGNQENTGTITVFEEPASPLARNTGRLSVLNVYPGEQAVDLVRITSEQFNDSRTVTPLIENVEPGTSQTVELTEGGLGSLALIQAGTASQVQNRGGAMNQNVVLGRLNDVNIVSETSQLVIVTARRGFDGTLDWRVLSPGGDTTAPTFGSPRAVGAELFTTYALPLQLVALLLLAAMVGVIVLTNRDMLTAPKPSREQRRKVSRPLTSVIASQTGSDLTAAPQIGAPKPESESGD